MGDTELPAAADGPRAPHLLLLSRRVPLPSSCYALNAVECILFANDGCEGAGRRARLKILCGSASLTYNTYYTRRYEWW